MIGRDMPAFVGAITKLAHAFRIKPDTSDFQNLTASYFRALERWDIGALERAADRLIETETRFPRAAEWAMRAKDCRVEVVALEAMSEADALQWLKAERDGWEGDPCSCRQCKAANVHTYPVRFVPEFDSQDREIKRALGSRIVVAGHWAHGEELGRYYLAKEQFWTDAKAKLKAMQWPEEKGEWAKLTPEQRIAAIWRKRKTDDEPDVKPEPALELVPRGDR